MNIVAELKLFVGPLVLGILLAFAICAAAPAPAAAQETVAAKITRLMDHSGYKYERKSSEGTDIWIVAMTGKSLKSFKVIIAAENGELLVAFVNPVTKKDLPLTPESLQKLLRLANSLDRVKIGIDDDGDLAVRIDETIRILDEKELADCIKQLAAASDEVYAAIKQ